MLPTNICEHCTYKLDMLYEFREASRKSEIILKRYLSNADYMSKDAQVSTVQYNTSCVLFVKSLNVKTVSSLHFSVAIETILRIKELVICIVLCINVYYKN